MELQLYLDILKRRIVLVVIAAAMALLVVTIVGVLTEPIYTARTTMRVISDIGMADFRVREDYTIRLMNTYTYLLRSSPTIEKVLLALLPRTAALTVTDVRDKVNVEVIPDTELITISVDNGDAELARDLANSLAAMLIEQAQNLYVGNRTSALQIIKDQLVQMENELEQNRQQFVALQTSNASSAELESLRSKIRFDEDSYTRLLDRYELAQLNESLQANNVMVIAPATLPPSPSNAMGTKEVGLALLAGLFGGLALALVLENLDTRIRSPQQLEHLTRLPVLGVVPRGILTVDKTGQISRTGKEILLVEAYRLVSSRLQRLTHNSSLKTILITSAVSGEGKTTVTINLARMLAEENQRTIFLLDGDMRTSALNKRLGTDNGQVGLSSLLVELSSLDQVIEPTEQANLFVINGGPVPPNPPMLLASPMMDWVLNFLCNQAQMTLIDTPPSLGIADVSILAPKVDGIILVAQQNITSHEQVNEVLKQLQALQTNIIGSIFVQRINRGGRYEQRSN